MNYEDEKYHIRNRDPISYITLYLNGNSGSFTFPVSKNTDIKRLRLMSAYLKTTSPSAHQYFLSIPNLVSVDVMNNLTVEDVIPVHIGDNLGITMILNNQVLNYLRTYNWVVYGTNGLQTTDSVTITLLLEVY
jgi:hypothetical protein